MQENNALKNGYGTTLYKEHETRMKPVFQYSVKNGLEIVDWVTYKENKRKK